MMNRRIAWMLVVMLMGAIGVAGAQDKPNFVTIVFDDMGFSDLPIFGGEVQTPEIDALAKGGITFNHFYAGSACTISRAMYFTGKIYHKAGIGTMPPWERAEQTGQPGYIGTLTFDTPPYFELLQQGGYHTMMTGKWDMGETDALRGSRRGFTKTRALLLPSGDTHYSYEDGSILSSRLPTPEPLYAEDGNVIYKFDSDFYSSDYYTKVAMEMLDEWKKDFSDQPFYLNVSHIAPHTPWQAPQEVTQQYIDTYSKGWDVLRAERFERQKKLGIFNEDLKLPTAQELDAKIPSWDSLSDEVKKYEAKKMAVYGAMIHQLDVNVGKLVQKLKDLGVYEDTVIIMFSDNGGAYQLPAANQHPRWETIIESGTYILRGRGPNATTTCAIGTGRFTTNPKTQEAYAACPDQYDAAEQQKRFDNMGNRDSYVGPEGNEGRGWGMLSVTPYRAYKGDLYEGGIHVPALVHYPKAAKTGKRTNRVMTVADIAPTLLEMAGIAYPSEYNGKALSPMDGVSFANIFTGELKKDKERLIALEADGSIMVRKDKWKLAQSRTGTEGSTKPGLYNLNKDPFELNNRAEKRQDIYNELMDAYDKFEEDTEPYYIKVCYRGEENCP